MAAHVFISGFVQGVGFRRFVRRESLKLGLTGWVKNLPDSRVEAIFCGSKGQIEKIISILRKGPFLSEVKGLNIVWNKDLKESFYKTFEIIH